MDYSTMFLAIIQGAVGGALIGVIIMIIGLSAYKITEIIFKIFKI